MSEMKEVVFEKRNIMYLNNTQAARMWLYYIKEYRKFRNRPKYTYAAYV